MYHPPWRTSDIPKDIETRIPVMGEKLGVSKTASTREATITKEPVTEKKTVEVPVTHEEMIIERRPAGETISASGQGPVESRTEVKVPLKSEEVQVTKQPYVKEEVAVKKKPVAETRTISDEVKSEKVNISGDLHVICLI
ncbi:MAG: YsnF/AvaK domain-containing protein [Candidatus Nitrosopolaris sp.]